MRPNTSSFLRRALDPPQRGRLSEADRKALDEVRAEEDRTPTLNSRFAPPPPCVPFEHVERTPYWVGLPDELPEPLLAAEPLRYEVSALNRDKTYTKSAHRVGPRKLYGLAFKDPVLDWMIAFADSESLRCAQRAAWLALAAGATRVEIRTYRRKAATGTRKRGHVEHDLVAVLTSLTDTVIAGEPCEKSLEIDAGFGV